MKSFQEEFFDETNNNIISMFDLLLNVDSTSISENIELWNQSSRATNVRRINSANHHRGLSMLLNISSEDYFITTDDFIGLKVSPISVLPTNIYFSKYWVENTYFQKCSNLATLHYLLNQVKLRRIQTMNGWDWYFQSLLQTSFLWNPQICYNFWNWFHPKCFNTW